MANPYEGMDPRIQALFSAAHGGDEDESEDAPVPVATAPQKDLELDPIAPAPKAAPVEAPPMLSPQALQDQQDQSQKDARMRMLIGGIGDSLSNHQSFGNFYLGRMNQQTNGGEQTAQAMNAMQTDPMKRQAQLYSNYKQAQDNQNQQLQVASAAALRDPDSAQSKSLKVLFEKNGYDVDASDSGASLQARYGSIADAIAANRDQDNKMELAQERNKGQLANTSAKYAEISAMKQMSASSKYDASHDKALKDTQQLLESARGNPAVQQAEKDIYAAGKLNSLVAKGMDNPAGVQLAATEVAKIASGGVPTSHELQGLVPNTVPSALAKLAEIVGNNPHSAQAGAFLKQYQAYANDIKDQAQGMITDRYGRILESNKGRLGDDNYGTLKGQYMDRFSNEAASKMAKQKASGESGSDVIAFAKSHGITAQQAQAIKDQRTSGMAKR